MQPVTVLSDNYRAYITCNTCLWNKCLFWSKSCFWFLNWTHCWVPKHAPPTNTHRNPSCKPHPLTVKRAAQTPASERKSLYLPRWAPPQEFFKDCYQLQASQRTSSVSFLWFLSLLQGGFFSDGNVGIKQLGAFDESQALVAKLRRSDLPFLQRCRNLEGYSPFSAARCPCAKTPPNHHHNHYY